MSFTTSGRSASLEMTFIPLFLAQFKVVVILSRLVLNKLDQMELVQLEVLYSVGISGSTLQILITSAFLMPLGDADILNC